MRLTVLGSCGAWPEAGRACSGLLVEAGGTRVAVDLGYGVLPRLLAALGGFPTAESLHAVVVTHRHPDHAVDLHGLFRARWFGARGAAPLPVHAAEGVRELVRGLEEPDEADDVDDVLDWHPLPGGDRDLGGIALSSADLPHWVPNAGVRLRAEGVSVVCTGDTGPSPALDGLARGADLLVAEATDRPMLGSTPAAVAAHSLDAAAAGRLARRAGVGRLLLTHFWPGSDREASRRRAEAEYDGEVLLADEGLVVDVVQA